LLHTALGRADVDQPRKPQRFDQYELVIGSDGEPVELGRGAMGVTYKAFDTNLRCEVALKVIQPRYLADEVSRARFLSEARVAAQLRHRNIASVFHLGGKRGEYFYAMELVEGQTIEEWIHSKGPIDCPVALDIALQITRALIATGTRQFVHRDVKPSNVMLCTEADGAIVAKLIDFGLVRDATVQSANVSSTPTRTGFIGTPHFASPEQFAGQTTDARSDIYSLGVTLWYMLSGKLPFDGTRDEIRRKQLSGSLPLAQLKGIPRAVVDLIGRMLKADAAMRPKSPGVLKEQLNNCIAAIDSAKQKQRRRFAYSALTAAVIITGTLAAAYVLQRKFVSSAANEVVTEKNVAVLPFQNLSGDTDNAYFADGVQDQVLTDLAQIADLKVISRVSVMQYKTDIARNLRKIGGELGVAHVVEGSVQRAGNKIRVNAQLIDVRTNAHLWAQTYDRDLDDVFAIQSEIAKAIAGQLHAKLSPSEKAAIEKPPTTDLAAFDLYTRAKTLLLSTTFGVNIQQNLEQAIELLNQAVARDPAFFEAYYQLVYAHGYAYSVIGDHTPRRLASAEAALQAATRLRPDAGETHLARANYLYRCLRDYDGALAELKVAGRSLPNDSRIFELTGLILRRRGQPEEGLRNLERAVELDPRNVHTLQQIALGYQYLRLYPQEAAVFDRVMTIVPSDVPAKITRAYTELDWKADTRRLHDTIDSILAASPGAISEVADAWFICALAERDPTAAERALVALGDNPCWGDDNLLLSHTFGEGLLARMMGDETRAHAAFTKARLEQEKIVQAQPGNGPPLSVLGLIDAGLGRKEEALQEGRRAIELVPVEKDSISGSRMLVYFAMIAAWAGEKDIALQYLAANAKSPGGYNIATYGSLKLLPFWDPLRGDPRFEEIVQSLAPK
jgi:serine/threonine protein kinase/tetratricopeptide (TPR) repeat protein